MKNRIYIIVGRSLVGLGVLYWLYYNGTFDAIISFFQKQEVLFVAIYRFLVAIYR